MWLLIAAGLLQCLLFFERILFRLLLPVVVNFFVQDQRSSVKKFADNSVVSSVWATVIYYAGIPLNFVLSIAAALYQNALFFGFILFSAGVLLIISDNFQRVMIIVIDSYNSGVGQTLDLLFSVSEIFEFFIRLVLPWYNAAVWFVSQFFLQVFIPLFSMKDVITQLPEFFSNLSLCISALVLSVHTYLSNFLYCATGAGKAGSSAYGFSPGNYTQNLPYTSPDLQCAVNQAYYTLDLMTPGSYMQQVTLDLQGLMYKTCSPAGFLIELLLYPLTDFNLYKSLHCAVNFLSFTVIAMPMMTYKRCKYADENDDFFTSEEIAVMCTPDWKPWISVIVEGQRSLGRLFDNWLDVSLAMVERVQGINQDLCKNTQSIDLVIQSASETLLSPVSLIRYVMLTDSMYAVTDGVSTLYHTMTDRTVSELAIGNWPFTINIDLGIAAVKVAETGESDMQANERTGMLGCQCIDEPIVGMEASGQTRIRILCASVPYFIFDDNETAYNTTTVQEIVFVNDHVRTLMTCQDTMIRVHTLRFSRHRVADGFTGTGPMNDLFDTMNLYGNVQPQSFSADAAIYIQPRCKDKTLSACYPGLDNCFPFCLGLHLSGQSEANITAFNAKRWDEYVTVSQTDCVGGFTDYNTACEPKGFAHNLLNYGEFSIFDKPVCDFRACTQDDRSTTLIELSQLNSEHPVLSNKTSPGYSGWVKLDEQPFAVAGDVMLRIVEGKLRITRLYDTNNGQYTLQHESLNLLHEESVDVLDQTTECAIKADDSCFNDAMQNNQIVLPPAYFSNEDITYVHAVASEWAVHWAINPENIVYEGKINRCQGRNMDQIEIPSSYLKPRVWTVKSMRTTNLEKNIESESNDVSFMVIPDWFNEDTACNKMAGLRITALEYVNEENILITVLFTTLTNYNLDTHMGFDPDQVKYEHYFLHPTKTDCFDPTHTDIPLFSCFKHISEGMFNTTFLATTTQLFGTFCPAMRRMPQLGSAAAEVFITVSHMVKLALDILSVMPVVYIDTIYDQSRTRPTFHSSLNGEFFNINAMLMSYQRAAMHIANTLPRLGKFMESGNEKVYEFLQPRLIGTAKVLQHFSGTVPLTGYFLSQLKGVNNIPIKTSMAQAYSAIQTTRASVITEKVKTSVLSMVSTVRLNVKFMREAIKQGLMVSARQAIKKQTGRMTKKHAKTASKVATTAAAISATSLISTVMFENQRDIKRFLTDAMRVQCHGLGEMLGHNAKGNALREMCLMMPEALDGILQVILVLSIDYPLMDCVCKQTRENEQTEIIVQDCLQKLYPQLSRVFMLEYLESSVTAFGENKCFVYMDQANYRLLTAFDRLQHRMYKAGAVLGTVMDSMLSFVPGYDAGQCFDYDISPYVMAIVPEPVDYFMGCMHTYDCRSKCTNEIQSFEEALAAVDSPPIFSDELTFMVDSRFFSDSDVEEGRDQLPFPAYGMQELSVPACEYLCEQSNIRCIVLMGMEGVNVTSAYYCLPRNYMESVYRQFPSFLQSYSYFNEWGSSDKIVSIFSVTTDNVLRDRLEVLLISVLDTETGLYTMWLYSETGERYKILETRDFEPNQVQNTIKDVTNDLFFFQTISNMRVEPSRGGTSANIYWVGIHETIETALNSESAGTYCMQKTIALDSNETSDFGQSIETIDCSFNIPNLLDDSFKIIDLYSSNQEHFQVWLPIQSFSVAPQIVFCNMTQTQTCNLEDGQIFHMQSSINDFVKVVGLDATVPVITTDENVALINRKFVTDTSEAAYFKDGPIIKLNFLLIGSLSNTRSWIHNVKLELDTTTNKYLANVRASEEVEQTMTIETECSIDSCVGCQTNDRNSKYVDLQMKCYAAAECAVARCVGTLVNTRKPLCNIGSLIMSLALDNYRIMFGYVWKSLAEKIIGIVEMTKERRNKHLYLVQQESFTALTCKMKDEIVLGSSVLTSIVGAFTYSLTNFGKDDLTPTSQLLDSNTNAMVVLSMTAITKFISSVGMIPVYMSLVFYKILECQRDLKISIFSKIISLSGIDIRLSMGNEKITEASDATVGMCLTDFGKEIMRDLSDKTSHERIQTIMQQILTDVVWFFKFEKFSPYWHVLDGAFAYLYGVVTAMMDVVQVIDWKNCKLPSISFYRADNCACNDKQFVIPESRKRSKISSPLTGTESLWCSGPMLLTTTDEKEFLIWNPYSLHELLNPEEVAGGSGNFEEYVECIASVEARSCTPPMLPMLEQQDVNVLQVITRCRSNYQQSRWDTGAILFGLYPLRVWTNPKVNLNMNLMQRDPTLDRFLFRFIYLTQFMEANPLIMDESTHACLSAALQMEVTEHTCAVSFYRNSQQYDSVNEYFQYEHTTQTSFVDRDACQVYSGDLQQADSGATFPMMLWRGSSSNQVPLAKMHYLDWDANSDRITTAEADLDLLMREIEYYFDRQEFNTEDSNRVQLTFKTWEGDSLHQFVDCVILGPYAAADLQSSFTMPNGKRLPVPQYYRNKPISREFSSHLTTSGSEARIQIMAEASRHVEDTMQNNISQHMKQQFYEIRAKYRDKQNMLCICKDLITRSLECCLEAKRENDIRFALIGEQERAHDLTDKVTNNAMDSLSESTKLQEEIWANPDRTYHSSNSFTAEEIEEMALKYVFNMEERVSRYGVDEALTNITDHTLWHRCMSLLSTAFFTLPLKPIDQVNREAGSTENAYVDADTFYDPVNPPEDSREQYLHGMEHAIERILTQAREKSPVFWTHMHRYIASDSVWCEDIEGGVDTEKMKNVTINEVFHNTSIFMSGLKDTPNAMKALYPAKLTCVCGWTNGTHCEIPDSVFGLTLHTALEGRSFYSSRRDYFILARALKDARLENCHDNEPNTAWGIFDSKHHPGWFQGTSTNSSVSLHEIATHGPAGIRLGMLKDDGEDALRTHTQRFDWSSKASHNQTHNLEYEHTVGQPVCRFSKHQLFNNTDFTKYLKDTLFPMAHSVFEAPVAAYCSTWAVEYALWHILHYAIGEGDEQTLIQQERAKLWKERCDIQLQQIGICNLRGVFELVPQYAVSVPKHCAFELASNHTCSYVTENCLVMCAGHLYDPCLCTEHEFCEGFVFQFPFTTKHCPSIWDPRMFATHDDVLLYSMHWPTSVLQNEAGDQDLDDLNAQLTEINRLRADFTFESEGLHQSIVNLIVDHDNENKEDDLNSFCTDLLDYFEGSEQHPIGYHPTRSFNLSETNLRGFDAWMSAADEEDHGFLIDPVRLRNMTQYSQTFGASHLVCDQSVYGSKGYNLNPYTLQTRWNVNAKVDMAVPLQLNPDILSDMQEYGQKSEDSEDTPCLSSSNSMLAHSVGLVRSWFRIYGADPELQEAYDNLWPHRAPNEELCSYQFEPDTPMLDCPHPELYTCESDDDCKPSSKFKCFKSHKDSDVSQPNEAIRGVCAPKDDCFQHADCSEEQMCSGEGKCVTPRIYFENEARDDYNINFQLFSKAKTDSCHDTMYGISEHQHIHNFAQSHGLCSLRNWDMYQNLSKGAFSEKDYVQTLDNVRYATPEEGTVKSAEEHDLLKMSPHPCDRDYQHTQYHYCEPNVGNVFKGFENEEITFNEYTALRTWKRKDNDTGLSIRMCDLGLYKDKLSLLNPYTNDEDSFVHVPAEIKKCTHFQVCENLLFHVNHRPVALRQKLGTVYTPEGVKIEPTVSEAYSHNDADTCFGIGHLVDDTPEGMKICMVDRLVMPLLAVLYGEFFTITTENILSTITDSDQLKRYNEIRHHCPSAFSQTENSLKDIGLYKHFLERLSFRYTEDRRNDVVFDANIILLSIFGLHTNMPVNRGFDTIEKYLEHSTCSRFLSTELDAFQKELQKFDIYTQDSLAPEQTPGDSLYLFHERAPVALSLPWVWKCVLLSKADEGAPTDWFLRITNPDYAVSSANLPCDIYNTEFNNLDSIIPVKELLKNSNEIFMTSNDNTDIDLEQSAADLVDSMQAVISNALNYLGLTQSPRINCMEISESDTGSWNKWADDKHLKKFCHENQCQDNGFNPNYNLYSLIFENVLGSSDMLYLRSKSLQNLKDENKIKFGIDLDAYVSKNARFIPYIQFPQLEAFVDKELQESESFDKNDRNQYAQQTNDTKCPYTLLSPEFEKIHNGFENWEKYRYISIHRAQLEVAKYFQREIYSPGVLPDNEYLHTTSNAEEKRFLVTSYTEDSDISTENYQVSNVKRAFDYNQFMKSKTYECKDDKTIQVHVESNSIPPTIRECVKQMRESIGWQVPHQKTFQVHVQKSTLTQGFYPTFSQEHTNKGFVDQLFDENLKEKTSLSLSVCFQLGEEIRSINPLWSGNYDVTSCPSGLSCGCDTLLRESRFVDIRCEEEGENECKDRFPVFNNILQTKIPPHCLDLGRTKQPVVMIQDGSLYSSETPLCRKTPSNTVYQQECSAEKFTIYGALHGWQGKRVENLHDPVSEPEVEEPGLFHTSNSIFRRNKFTPQTLPVLRVLKTDIGGHALHFQLKPIGRSGHEMHLEAVLLQSNPQRKTLSIEKNWLQNIESKWQWQHARLEEVWPRPSVFNAPSWKCPLQRIAAYSDSSKTFATRTPNALRNQVRFKHITNQHEYAHPTVQSASKLTNLVSAYYKADHIICAMDKESCVTPHQLSEVIQTLYHRPWTLIKIENTTQCTQILDWPHQSYRLRDAINSENIVRGNCFVLDRLPGFAIKLETQKNLTRDSSIKSNSDTSPAMQSGGVCHMGRLHRLKSSSLNVSGLPGTQHLQLQMCKKHGEGNDEADTQIKCLFTENMDQNASNVRVFYETFERVSGEQVQVKSDKRALMAKRKCNQCPAVKTQILDRFLNKHDVPFNNRRLSQLSVGEPARLSTERMIAAYLRRKVCPVASDVPCESLLTIFNTSVWQKGQFLPRFLNKSRYHELFHSYNETFMPRGELNHLNRLNDSALWTRPWVYCDQSKEQNQGCQGTISKRDWTNVSTRFQQCRSETSTATAAMNLKPTINFCQLTFQTEDLCKQMIAWNAEIKNILCRASGLCSDVSFFYNPAMYAVDNQAFVSASVQEFYTSIDQDKCSQELDEAQKIQVESNKQAKLKCASVNMEVLRFLIQQFRLNATTIFKLAYYFIMMIIQAVQVVIAGAIQVTGGNDLVGDAITKLGRYFILFIEQVGSLIRYLIDMIWKLLVGQEGTFGRELRKTIKVICDLLAVVKNALCDFVTPIHGFFDKLFGITEELRDWGPSFDILGQTITIPLLAPLLLHPVILGFVGFVYNGKLVFWSLQLLFCMPFSCADLDFSGAETSFSGALPVATRCWASYTTFFGDTQGLSCTAADTCLTSHTDLNSRQVCATCAETSSNLIDPFGCDPLLKMCMCGVVKHERTYCRTNFECKDPSATCSYIDRDLEPSFTSVECTACQTNRVCYFNKAEDEIGFCACPLFKTGFSRCRATDRGSLVSPEPDKFCLFEPDSKYASSVTYSSSFDNTLTAPCYSLDPTQTYCTKIVDVQGIEPHFIVGLGTSIVRRRLLEAAEKPKSIITQNPVCQDALQYEMPFNQNTRKACIEAFKQSSETVLMLNNSLMPCTFCSSEDMLYAIRHQATELTSMFQTPRHTLLVLCRHGFGKHVFEIFKSTLKASRLILHDLYQIHLENEGETLEDRRNMTASSYKVDFDAKDILFPTRDIQVDFYANDTQFNLARNHSTEANASSSRRLLSFAHFVKIARKRVSQMVGIHTDYSTQLAVSFDYTYANLYTDNTRLGWFAHWPPDYQSPETASQCTPFWNTLGILEQAIGNASITYLPSGRAMKGTPVTYLHEAWPRVPNVTNSSSWINPKGNRAQESNKGIVGAWVWLIETIFSSLKLTTNAIYDLIFASSKQANNLVQCNYESVQTCSLWRITLFHSTIVASMYFIVWFLIARTMQISFVASLSMIFFIPLIFYLSYQYSPTCAPMIPTCFFEDLILSLRLVFPKFMRVPSIFIRARNIQDESGATFTCTEYIETRTHNTWITQKFMENKIACIKSCVEPPLEFTSWRAVLAWFVTEFGQGAVDWVVEAQSSVPLIDHQDMHNQLLLKNYVWKTNDADMLLTHRICALTQSYQLLPFFFLILLLLITLRPIVNITASASIPLLNSLTAMMNSVFVKNNEEGEEKEGRE